MKVDLDNQTEAVELRDLGRINVLCGPNSAGKSTLLRALEGQKPRLGVDVRAITIDDEIWERVITEKTGRQTAWPVQAILRAREWLLAEGESGTVLYSDECDEFGLAMTEAWQEWEEWQRYFHFDLPGFSTHLKSLCGESPVARTLQATRELTTITDLIAVGMADHYDGKAVVSKLYRAINRQVDSAIVANLETLRRLFARVTDGCDFVIDRDDKEKLNLHFRFGHRELVHADKCGMGLQEILAILYYAVFDDAEILLIEEPENHLHPTWQRELLKTLKEETSKIYVLATHSSTMLDETVVDRVFASRFTMEGIEVSDQSDRVETLREMGYARSDFVTAEVLALVEGPHDRDAIEVFLETQFGSERPRVAYHLLGGDIMHYAPLKHLKEAFGEVVAFVDSELAASSKRVRKKFAARCKSLKIPCTLSALPTMEHYYSVEAYRTVFPQETIPDVLDAKQLVKNQIMFDPKKSSRALAANTEWKSIQGTDLGKFLKKLARPKK